MFTNQQQKRKLSEDDDESNTPVAMFNDPIKVNDVDAYLDEEIGPPSKYRNMLHYMRSMDDHDRLRIWINSGGGRQDSMNDIVDAMKNTKGDVTVIVTGMAASAAGVIALNAPKLVLGDRGFIMAHNGSFGSYGKNHEVVAHVKHMDAMNEKELRETYKYFMTDEEIQQCIEGKDFWFDNAETKRRLEIRHAAQEAELKKAQRKAKAKPAAA